MKKEPAYDLDGNKERFRDEIEKKGFKYELSGQISRRVIPSETHPENTLYVAGIVDGRYLVVYTKQCNQGDSRFDRSVSKLQRIARAFDVNGVH